MRRHSALIVGSLLLITAALGAFLMLHMRVVYGIRDLRNEDTGRKNHGMEILRKAGPRAQKDLVDLLSKCDGETAWRAAVLLGEFGDAQCIEPLFNRLKYMEPECRRQVVEALHAIGLRLPEAQRGNMLERMFSAMGGAQDTDLLILAALGDLGAADEVAAMLLYFSNDNEAMRRAAMQAVLVAAERGVEFDTGNKPERSTDLYEKAVFARVLALRGDERGARLAFEVLQKADITRKNDAEVAALAAQTFDRLTRSNLQYRADEPQDKQRGKIEQYIAFYQEQSKTGQPVLLPRQGTN